MDRQTKALARLQREMPVLRQRWAANCDARCAQILAHPMALMVPMLLLSQTALLLLDSMDLLDQLEKDLDLFANTDPLAPGDAYVSAN
jgi:hypothetical protein